MNADPVRFGIVGCGRIARDSIAPALHALPGCALAAAASRERARAEALRPVRAYGDYQGVIEDPAVEVVFVASHNGDHREWTLKALAAGKHVMCEKPLGRSAAEVREMGEAAARAGRHLLDAFMYRFHPQMDAVRAALAAGEIGEPRRAEAWFTFRIASEKDVRMTKEWGGGALLDVGVYCADFVRAALGGPPASARAASARFHPYRDVDLHVAAECGWDNGAEARFECGFDAPFEQWARVRGSEGSIALDRPWISWKERPTVAIERRGARRLVEPGIVDPYRLELEHMARVVRGLEGPRFPLSDSLDTLRILDCVKESARAFRAV
jgi:predicted dehydrogenase